MHFGGHRAACIWGALLIHSVRDACFSMFLYMCVCVSLHVCVCVCVCVLV